MHVGRNEFHTCGIACCKLIGSSLTALMGCAQVPIEEALFGCDVGLENT